MKTIHDDGVKRLSGSQLSQHDRDYVLGAYVHRFTRNHVPNWARGEWKDGKPYPVQFDSDADWLANTEFAVNDAGRLRRDVNDCYSRPTWPDDPELRARDGVTT